MAAGLLFAGLLGLGIYSAQELLLNWQDQFQTVMVLVAAALIVQMVLWMRQHGRTLKRELEQGLSSHLEQRNWWGVAVLAALAALTLVATVFPLWHGVRHLSRHEE